MRNIETILIDGVEVTYHPYPWIIYVYCLVCPISNKTFYVGKTDNPNLQVRLQTHCAPSNPNTKLKEKIASLKDQGFLPEIQLILASYYSRYEGHIIKEYAKKYELLNRAGVVKRPYRKPTPI